MCKGYVPFAETTVAGGRASKSRSLLNKPSLYSLFKHHKLTVDQLAYASFVGNHVIEALIWKIPASKRVIEGVLEGLYRLTRVRYSVEDVDMAIYEPETTHIYAGPARPLSGTEKAK